MSRFMLLLCTTVAGLGLAVSTEQALGQVPGAPGFTPTPPPMTIWRFLGIPQGVQKIRDVGINRNGNFPGLERKPPLKRIGDPENLFSDNPAIKKAAEIKTQEDLKKQKIKAIKYLATIGCGCYKGVDEALLAALDDCTEEVRYEAAKALRDAAGENCKQCGSNSCCGKEVMKKLAEIAYEKDDTCCWKEASERVREMAKEAMRACIKPAPPGYTTPAEVPSTAPVIPPETPPETPVGDVPPTPPLPPEVTNPTTSAPAKPATEAAIREMAVKEMTLAPAAPELVLEFPADASAEHMAAAMKVLHQPSAKEVVAKEVQLPTLTEAATALEVETEVAVEAAIEPAAPTYKEGPEVKGKVALVDKAKDLVKLTIPMSDGLHVGQRVTVFHSFLLQKKQLGQLEIVSLDNGAVVARPVGELEAKSISKGDEVVARMMTIEYAQPELEVAEAEAPVAPAIVAKPVSLQPAAVEPAAVPESSKPVVGWDVVKPSKAKPAPAPAKVQKEAAAPAKVTLHEKAPLQAKAPVKIDSQAKQAYGWEVPAKIRTTSAQEWSDAPLPPQP